MAECNWCDSKAWFFQLNRSGLCAECGPTVQADIDEHVRYLDAPEKPAASADWQTWLAHYDGIRKHLSALLRYEGCGIPTIDPPPSAAMVDCDEDRAKVILAAATEFVETSLTRVEAAETPTARMEVASETLAQVKEFRDLLGEPLPEYGDNNATVLLKLQQRVESFIGPEDSTSDAPTN